MCSDDKKSRCVVYVLLTFILSITFAVGIFIYFGYKNSQVTPPATVEVSPTGPVDEIVDGITQIIKERAIASGY